MVQLIEKRISNLIEQQFPSFYQDQGQGFIQFVKAYYEWLEEQDNPLYYSRRLFELRDIDDTVEEFLIHFQKKYLCGIPFNVIINKRYLLKHILDVYRSKGSIQCYKLLFRLIYDQDIDVYLPGVDILRVSDGSWVEPKYLEVTSAAGLANLVGKKILGVSSGVSAVCESYIQEPINQNIISTLFISNVHPRGGQFKQGEKVIDYSYKDSANISQIISSAPAVTGSLDSISIINGGQNFNVGDILKIVHRDLQTNQVISSGIDGLVKVMSLTRSQGAVNFRIVSGGFGYLSNASIFIYNGIGDTTGQGASFQIGPLSYSQVITYNTDLIIDHTNLALNAVSFGLDGNASCNISNTLQDSLYFTNGTFGTIATLADIKTGNSYTQSPYITIRSSLVSGNLQGTISYSTTSNTVTGTSTDFSVFSNNDCIYLQSNGSNTSTGEYQIIKQVTNTTQIILYGPPTKNSTPSALYSIATNILSSNFALYDPIMFRPDGTVNGLNANVFALPSSGNDVIGTTEAINSGKGYVDSEVVTLYLTGGLSNPVIVNGGTNYSNNDQLVFSGGNPNSIATGYVTTNSTGGIITAIISKNGSGYQSTPTVRVKSINGRGAVIQTTVQEFNTQSEVVGTVVKAGQGKGRGYWSTTRGFLNSDKYIQDSYFYQDFSYQIKAALTLDKYKDILYNTFHIAGTELFGEYLLKSINSSNVSIAYSNTTPTIS